MKACDTMLRIQNIHEHSLENHEKKVRNSMNGAREEEDQVNHEMLVIVLNFKE